MEPDGSGRRLPFRIGISGAQVFVATPAGVVMVEAIRMPRHTGRHGLAAQVAASIAVQTPGSAAPE